MFGYIHRYYENNKIIKMSELLNCMEFLTVHAKIVYQFLLHVLLRSLFTVEFRNEVWHSLLKELKF